MIAARLQCKLPGECDSERIVKIGRYLTKLCVEYLGVTVWRTLYVAQFHEVGLSQRTRLGLPHKFSKNAQYN